MSMTVDRQLRVLWGEYWANRERTEVHIVCSCDQGRSYEPVKTFSPGQVRHVHGVWQDPFEDGYWVLTGDEDKDPVSGGSAEILEVSNGGCMEASNTSPWSSFRSGTGLSSPRIRKRISTSSTPSPEYGQGGKEL